MPTGIYKHKKGYHLSEEAKRNISEAKKGKRLSEETRKKLSEAKMGKKRPPFSKEWKKKISEAKAGKKRPSFSKEWRRRMSEAHKGKKSYEITDEIRKKLSEAHKGKHPSEEARRKMSEAQKGEKSYLWKGGITPKNARIRNSIEFRLWREAVFARDNWQCQRCGTRSGNGKTIVLHPHHILNFAEYLELRFVIDNGITLCKSCHMEFHKKYGRKNNTEEQLAEFIRQKLA